MVGRESGLGPVNVALSCPGLCDVDRPVKVTLSCPGLCDVDGRQGSGLGPVNVALSCPGQDGRQGVGAGTCQ